MTQIMFIKIRKTINESDRYKSQLNKEKYDFRSSYMFTCLNNRIDKDACHEL